jgi:NAD(P)-dependent dehydrogenase (short-subunit alcohol dehydrogenase family)
MGGLLDAGREIMVDQEVIGSQLKSDRFPFRRPERIIAMISQNGNAYLEGLSEGWNPIQASWKNPSRENRAALRGFLMPEATRTQYTTGVPTPELLSPDAWTLDSALLARPTSGTSLCCSSKAAINLLTKSWTAEYGASSVRVNAVSAPGLRALRVRMRWAKALID